MKPAWSKRPVNFGHHPMFGQWEPKGFNPDCRPGIGPAISKAYAAFCEENPDASQDDRRQAYQSLYESLRKDYPSLRELENASSNH